MRSNPVFCGMCRAMKRRSWQIELPHIGDFPAANLLLDFDYIEQAAERGAPKYLEWYGAFALMVTLVWLYMEILRLLSKLRSRD